MRIEVFSSWDEMMGQLLAERTDFAIFETAGSRHLYWSDYNYSESVRKAFPYHKILDHGDYFTTSIISLTITDIMEKVISAVLADLDKVSF